MNGREGYSPMKVTVPVVITSGHFRRDAALSELRRAGADRVALALDREMDFAFSSEENLAFLKELIAYFEGNGLEVMVWLGETFGHTGAPIAARGKYTPIRRLDGGDTQAFCPMDADFRRDFCAWVQKVARAGAKMIMLDDDFRLGCRGGIGCACDLHMARIRELLGEDVSRELLLREAFSGGRNRYRDAWRTAQGDSLEDFARALRCALDEIDPACRLGFCACIDTWDTSSTDAFRLSRIMAGRTKPFLRTIGAPYWARKLGDTVSFVRCELTWAQEEARGKAPIEIFTEGDTYPRPRFATPASHLECFDQILRADGRASGILKYMLDYVSDATYETGYIDAMLRAKPLYDILERDFAPKRATGVRIWNFLRKFEYAALDPSRPNLLAEVQEGLFDAAYYFAVRCSLSMSDTEGDVNLVFGENARHLPTDVLRNGTILDAPAALLLMQRGVDVGIEKALGSMEHTPSAFQDMPKEYYIAEDQYVRLSEGVSPVAFTKKAGAEVLTRFVFGNAQMDGAFRYENQKGERFWVLPYCAADAKNALGWFDNYCMKRLAGAQVEWLSQKRADAVLLGNHPMLYLMTKRGEEELAVGIWNLSDDRVEGLSVRLGRAYRDVRFLRCEGKMCGDTATIATTLYPYEFAGLVAR
jgi:hypothetical protein